MLGGGTFTTQNKILGGTYINFISASRASATLADRGVVALPIALDWGEVGKVWTLTTEDFQKNSLKLLGYDYTADELMAFREVFKNAQKVHIYNLNDGEGTTKASSKYATAKYAGVAGNKLKVVIQQNVDDESKFDVALYMGTSLVDKQTVATSAELKENAHVTWASADLALTAGEALSGGVNGASSNASYQNALDAFESYAFNSLGCASTDSTIVDLFVEYTKRMRDQVGAKFQLVEATCGGFDYEGVVSVKAPDAKLVYWAMGAVAGCAVNKSLTNKKYDGELEVNANYTQTELEGFIKAGYFAFHMVEDELRVLTDINSFTSFTKTKTQDFSYNQVIRVLDQTANDTASLFNTKYHGKIQNDNSGRVSLWNDVLTHRRKLENLRAIEDYNSDALIIKLGENKKAVSLDEALKPTCAMEQLYITTVVE